jgi:hypothetical protein
VLALPIAGLAVTFWKLAQTIVVGAWNRTAGRPIRRGALAVATAVAAAGAVYTWLPNGDYRPIQAGERGTLQGGVAELASVQTGRPSLTPKRSDQLHGAPTKASQPQDKSKPAQVPSSSPTGTSSTTTTSVTTTGATATTPSATTSTPAATTPVAPAQTTTTPTDTTTTTTTTTTDTTTTPTTTTTPLP